MNANQNAALNGCEHVSFLCDDAANKLTYLSKKRSIDVLVVDPPEAVWMTPCWNAFCEVK